MTSSAENNPSTVATIKDDKRMRAMQHVKDVEASFDQLMVRIRPKLRDWYEVYRTFENQQALPGQSNVFVPKLYEIIEKKTPALVAHNPTFLITPRVNEAIKYIAPLRDALAFWWEEENMPLNIEKSVKSGLIFGKFIAKAGWIQEVSKEKAVEYKYNEETEEEEEVEVEEDVVTMERPTYELIDILDFKIDPRVENVQEGIGCIQTIDNVRMSDLLKDEGMYDLSRIKKNKEEYSNGSDSEYNDVPEKRDIRNAQGIDEALNELDKGTFTIKEFWGLFSEDGDCSKEREYVITTIWQDGSCADVIRCEPNPFGFRPYVEFDDHVVPGEFFSIGEIEPLESLQIEFNNIRNARLDFNNAINYPEWMYNVNANINPANLVHKPNNLIPVDIPLGSDVRNSLRPVDKPIQPLSGVREEEQINRDFQAISQTIDYTIHTGTDGITATAAGVRSRDAERGAQANNVVKHLEKTISDLGEMWLKLAAYFVDDKITIRKERTEADVVPGKTPSLEQAPVKFTELKKEVFENVAQNYIARVEAGSTTSHSAIGQAENSVAMGNLAAQFIGLGVPIDAQKIFQDILKKKYQISNPETYIKASEPQQPSLPGASKGATPPMQGAMPGGKIPMQPTLPNDSM